MGLVRIGSNQYGYSTNLASYPIYENDSNLKVYYEDEYEGSDVSRLSVESLMYKDNGSTVSYTFTSSSQLYKHFLLYLKDKNGNYIYYDHLYKYQLYGTCNFNAYVDESEFAYLYSGRNYNGEFRLTGYRFLAAGESFYIRTVLGVSNYYFSNPKELSSVNLVEQVGIYQGNDYSKLSASSPYIANRFCASGQAEVKFYGDYLACRKIECFRSYNNGETWQMIGEYYAPDIWTLETPYGEIEAEFNTLPGLSEVSILDDNISSTAWYKSILYNDETMAESEISLSLDILDISLPSTITINNISEYLNCSSSQINITKCTVSDMSRISFTERFNSTNLPNTKQILSTGIMTYTLNSLDENNSLSTNLGNYFLKANGNYAYRIIPILDNSINYTSSSGNSYIQFNYKKNTSQLEVIKDIEMGSVLPKSLKLIIAPDITDNSDISIQVANNGNDEEIIWENFPKTSIATMTNSDCEIYKFTNTTKTAENWKLKIKIIANKGSSHLKISNIIAFINNGLSQKISSIKTGSYVGTGTAGSSNPTKLNCDFIPLFMIISNGIATDTMMWYGSAGMGLGITSITLSLTYTGKSAWGGSSSTLTQTKTFDNNLTFNFDETGISWYNALPSSDSYTSNYITYTATIDPNLGAEGQYNKSGLVYYYMILG